MKSKLKSFLKLIDQKNVEGGQKKVRVIEYPQIVWGGGPHTNQTQTLEQYIILKSFSITSITNH